MANGDTTQHNTSNGGSELLHSDAPYIVFSDFDGKEAQSLLLLGRRYRRASRRS